MIKSSICITLLNEFSNVTKLLDSVLSQVKKDNEIIFVDGGSTDGTVELIKFFEKEYSNIKLMIYPGSRSVCRNIGVKRASGDIIVMTDAGCVVDKDWLKKITSPFKETDVDVVAGFYRMVGETPFQKAEAVYLGTSPQEFNVNFLPSTRSIAFRKSIWEKVEGFPEDLNGAAEDTVFNYKLIKANAKIARVKTAQVEWKMPNTIKEFFNKIRGYAKGDAQSGIWFFPGKGLKSHNIKVLLIYARYLLGLLFFYLGLLKQIFWYGLLIFTILYLFRSYKKAGVWGILLQFVADFAAMIGFAEGLLNLK